MGTHLPGLNDDTARPHLKAPPHPPLSPSGRGLRRLSERSELSRSWVRGVLPSTRQLFRAHALSAWIAATTASVTIRVVALPPRSGVWSAGSAVTRSTA